MQKKADFTEISIRQLESSTRNAAYLFITPALLIITLFVIVPLISSFIISLTDMDIFMQDVKFIGFNNFMKSFREERVWNAFMNTFKYVIFSVPIQIAVSLVLAFWLYHSDWFSKMMRSVYFIPVICSFSSLGIMFKIFFGSAVGWFPYVVSLFTKNGEPSFWTDIRYAISTDCIYFGMEKIWSDTDYFGSRNQQHFRDLL